jgi:hypothetical protein
VGTNRAGNTEFGIASGGVTGRKKTHDACEGDDANKSFHIPFPGRWPVPSGIIWFLFSGQKVLSRLGLIYGLRQRDRVLPIISIFSFDLYVIWSIQMSQSSNFQQNKLPRRLIGFEFGRFYDSLM